MSWLDRIFGGGTPKAETSNEGMPPPNTIPHIPLESQNETGVFTGTDAEISANTLAPYISPSYHISLALVRKPAGSATPDYLESLDRVYFMSSGSTKYSSVDASFDEDMNISSDTKSPTKVSSTDIMYFPNTLNIKTVKGPSNANPELGLVVEIKMGVHEPHGTSLDREIRRVAQQLGYSGGLHHCVWRIGIHWSGYTEDGTYVPKIPIRNFKRDSVVHEITYFCNMITMDTKVDASTGTNYELHLLPVSLGAVRPEVIKLDAYSWEAGTMGELTDIIAQTLSDATVNEVNGIPEAKYEIIYGEGCDHIRDSQIGAEVEDIINKSLRTEGTGANRKYIMSTRDDSLIALIRGILNSLPEVQVDFVRPNDTAKVEPRITYIIRTEVDHSESYFDPKYNDLSGVKYRFIIEKFYDWRTYAENIAIVLNPEYVKQRIASAKSFGAIRRIYNYAYTSESHEVLNFDISLKVFYHEHIGSEYLKSNSGQGGFTNPKTPEEQREITSDHIQANSTRTMNEEGAATSKGLSHNPSKGGSMSPFHVTYKNIQIADQNKEQDVIANLTMTYNAQFEQRLYNDLIKLEGMKVVGDPVWLLSRESHGWQGQYNASEIMRININRPDQRDYMNTGEMSTEANLSMGGYYEIITVNHDFSGGLFTQSLEGYRLKNFGID